ncbi:hypothetical protein EMIT0180MI3_11189 [Priestia megaterium]
MLILIWVSYAIITIIFQTSYEIARKVLTVEEKNDLYLYWFACSLYSNYIFLYVSNCSQVCST